MLLPVVAVIPRIVAAGSSTSTTKELTMIRAEKLTKPIKIHTPCLRLNPGTRIRCGAESMAVVHAEANGAEYLTPVCYMHHVEARQLRWAAEIIAGVDTGAVDGLG